jgi:hypothetical protein
MAHPIVGSTDSPALNARLPVLSGHSGSAFALDREGSWCDALTFTSHGAVIGVRSNNVTVLERVAASLPTGAQLCDEDEADAVYTWRTESGSSASPVHTITMRCRRHSTSNDITRTTDVEKALAVLNHDAEFRVAIYSPEDVFIHAAVVSWFGRAVLIPGHSFAGKSTLAAELVRQGAPYFSDEYAVLDAAGNVRPFTRRLMLRSHRGLPQGRFSPEELGGTRAAQPLPVSCLVVTRYVAGTRWKPQRMSRGEMVLALLAHAIDVQARPAHTLERTARALGADVIGLRGDRGEAAVAARQILDHVSELAVTPALSCLA